MISTAIFLTLTVVCGWGDSQAWLCVVAVALIATIYTMAGGLRSVAITDALQALVILVAAIAIFGTVSKEVGGWSGLEAKIAETDSALANQTMHIGSDRTESVDASKFSEEIMQRHLKIGGTYDPELREITRTTPAWLNCIEFFDRRVCLFNRQSHAIHAFARLQKRMAPEDGHCSSWTALDLSHVPIARPWRDGQRLISRSLVTA